MPFARIQAIDYYLPEKLLGNEELAALYDGWTAQSIEEKLGIRTRHIAADDETSVDMAVCAAQRLFDRGVCSPDEIDFLLLCTQSPDFFLPTSACIVQDRLGVPKQCGALDFNLGCSGFVYGLSLVKGLIETGQARKVLLITSETYSKYIHDRDRTNRPLFGDGAAATLVTAVDESENVTEPAIGPFVYGTDGSGSELLIVPAGAHRLPPSDTTAIEETDIRGGVRSQQNLYMHGPGIFSFANKTVPLVVEQLLEKSKLTRDDIDLFVFHQANKFMLEKLRKQCNIDPERYVVDMIEVGNTVGSTIPIAIADSQRAGRIQPGARLMLVGFGVGLSWGAVMVRLGDSV